MLLTVIGSAAYSVLHNLLAPEIPKTKTYEELSGGVASTLRAKTTGNRRTFPFLSSREQRVGESVSRA